MEINWRDNPWFPSVLDEERKKAKRSMKGDDFEHIWEGKAGRLLVPSIATKWKHCMPMAARAKCPTTQCLPVHTVWDLAGTTLAAVRGAGRQRAGCTGH